MSRQTTTTIEDNTVYSTICAIATEISLGLKIQQFNDIKKKSKKFNENEFYNSILQKFCAFM
jgi:hypothetical protein